MKLTILDAQAANPGDLSWDSFKDLAQVQVYQTTEPEDVVKRIGDSDAILLNKINIDSKIISQCKNLKYIGVLATGYNVIDVEAVKKAGIVVTNIPAYSTMAVSQHVFALILHFTNHIAIHNDSVHKGNWINAPVFCYWEKPLSELSQKTLGILGYGNIGQQVEKIAKAFDMNVIVCPHKTNGNKNCVSLDELFIRSDFISLHVPLTEETKEIINKNTLSKMKKSAYLINTARGNLINERDLTDALNNEIIAGYACDVVSEEPMKKDNPLLNAKNCILTPHIAWAALETRKRCIEIGFNNFKSWIEGDVQNSIY